MASNTPFSFQEDTSLGSQASSINSRKKLMQALQDMAMKGNYRNANTAPYELLANLGTMYMNKMASEKFAGQEAELAKKQRADIIGSATAYMDRRDGKAGETMSDEQANALMNNDQNVQVADGMAADPRGALIQAMSSQHPELQKMAAMDAQMMMKAKQPREAKYHTLGDKIYGEDGQGGLKEAVHNPKPEKSYTQETIMIDNKPVLVNREKGSNQVSAIGSGGTNVNVNSSTNFDKKQDEFMAKETSEIAKKARNDVESSVGALKNSQNLLKLLDSGDMFTGAGAEIKLNVARVASALGMKDYDPKITNTQAVVSQLANATLDTVKRLPGAITEKERPFLEQAAAGQITWTPETLQRLALINQAAQHNSVLQSMNDYRNANDRMGDYKNLHAMPTFNYKMDPRLQYNEETGQASLKDEWSGPATMAPGSPMATGQPVSGNSGPQEVIIRKWGGS